MKFRIAKKVIYNWSHGRGWYGINHFGTVIKAYRKLESYYKRHGISVQLPGLPSLDHNGVRTARKKEKQRKEALDVIG